LSRPDKTLPCKFFYDRQGSRLFDRICTLDEYYPTRTELQILHRHKADIARLMGRHCHLIEFGSGSSQKIRSLLDTVKDLATYTAVDISKDHLLSAAAALAADFPHITVTAVCADYTVPFEVEPPAARQDAKRVGFFPGSTIGNFTPDEATVFLKQAAGLLREGGEMLVGVDLKKPESILIDAYNDREGVTAQFNLNLLRRINRELDGTFDLGEFAHEAPYNAAAGRIEMHLISRRAQDVRVAGRTFHFRAGESIHTENSHKFSVTEFREISERAGFEPLEVWTDPDALFSVHYLRVL
jgi:dimethylhistidine N-methyltransferase